MEVFSVVSSSARTNRGQIMVPFLLFVVFIFVAMNMLVELLKVSRERVNLQRAADAGALAMATFQARTLNAVADKNFILKYPSGDRSVVAHIPDILPGDPLPGMNMISQDKFSFGSEAHFTIQMKIMGLHQSMQDQFIDLYRKLVLGPRSRIGSDYVLRNLSKEARENVVFSEPTYSEDFDFQRIPTSVKYVDWLADASGSTLSDSIMVPTYMVGAYKKYLTGVNLELPYKFFGQEMTLQAGAIAEVIPNGTVWSDCANTAPAADDIMPTYDARLVNQ